MERLERGKERQKCQGGLPVPIPVGKFLAQVPDKCANEEDSR